MCFLIIMVSTFEMQLLEKLEPGSYIAIERGNTYVGKLVRYEGFSNLNIEVRTKSIGGYEVFRGLGILSTDKIILGEEIFERFGGEKAFRHALFNSPYKKEVFTEQELEDMYSEKINQIVNNIRETARKYKEMQESLPTPKLL